MRQLLIVLLAAFAGSSAAAAPPSMTELEAVSGVGEPETKNPTEDLNFLRDQYQRMTVPVKLGGAGPYRFLVDTGADRTAISRDLALRHKLAGGASAVLHSVAGVSNVSTANVPSLELNNKSLRITDAPLLETGNMGADGILGVDSLRSQRILFDFQSDTMSIVPSAKADFEREPGSIVIRASRRNGRLVLTKATANGRSVNVVIDTGSQITIGNHALRAALLKRGEVQGSHPVQVHSVTGQKIDGDYLVIKRLEIGGMQLNGLAVVFADAHTFKVLGLRDKPALLLGMNAMRAFKKVSIDFANRKLRVVLPHSSPVDIAITAPLAPNGGIVRSGRRN